MPGTVYTIQLKVAGQEQVKQAQVDISKLSKANQEIIGALSPKAREAVFNSDAKLLAQALVQNKTPMASSGAVPPVISSAKGIDWKQFFLGLGVAPFSPYIGARALSGSGAFGAGGGGNGGILGALSGAGGFSGLLKAFIAIEVASRAFRFAIEQMTQAVQRGAQLYLKAAEIGTSAFTTSRLQKTASLLGMPESALTNLVASGQFMRGQKVSGSDVSNIIIGSGRGVLGKEELQGLLNLSNEVAQAWKRVLVDAQASAQVSHELFKTNMGFAELKSAWQSLWEQGVTLIEVSTNLQGAIELVTDGMRLLTMAMQGWNFLLQKIGLEAKDNTGDFSRKVPGASVGRPESAWEKMGLIISGGIGGSDFARQTAQNTKRIADVLDRNIDMAIHNNFSTQQFSLP